MFDSPALDVNNQYHLAYNQSRYQRKMRQFKELLGGKCVRCGTEDELEFDHIDPATKSFTICQGWAYAEDKVLEELEKCQLLCGEHHREKTTTEQEVEHGGGMSGKKNCKCDLCRSRKNEYMREWKRNRKLLV